MTTTLEARRPSPIEIKTIVALAAWFAIVLLLILGRTASPEYATVEMEQLALRGERAQTIHPVTAQEIERLLRQPAYDCTQVACGRELAARNSMARARLQTVLTEKTDVSFKVPAGELQPLAHASAGSE
jgi:hypothetical protein